MSHGYQYEGLEAELYDELDELSDFEDLHFYLWFVEAGLGPVLDLGCGTGRVLMPLTEKGLEVVGLDNSKTMLELCSQKLDAAGLAAELVLGDLRDFDFGSRRFGTIIVPGFSVQLLLEDADLEAFLDNCLRHLKADGQLILPTHLPWEMIWDGCEEKELELRREVRSRDGECRLRAWQGWVLDTLQQRLLLKNRYERVSSEGEVLKTEDKEMTLRWHLPHEMLDRLLQAGFSDVAMYGDFEFDAPEEDSESVVYVARV